MSVIDRRGGARELKTHVVIGGMRYPLVNSRGEGLMLTNLGTYYGIDRNVAGNNRAQHNWMRQQKLLATVRASPTMSSHSDGSFKRYERERVQAVKKAQTPKATKKED